MCSSIKLFLVLELAHITPVASCQSTTTSAVSTKNDHSSKGAVAASVFFEIDRRPTSRNHRISKYSQHDGRSLAHERTHDVSSQAQPKSTRVTSNNGVSLLVGRSMARIDDQDFCFHAFKSADVNSDSKVDCTEFAMFVRTMHPILFSISNVTTCKDLPREFRNVFKRFACLCHESQSGDHTKSCCEGGAAYIQVSSDLAYLNLLCGETRAVGGCQCACDKSPSSHTAAPEPDSRANSASDSSDEMLYTTAVTTAPTLAPTELPTVVAIPTGETIVDHEKRRTGAWIGTALTATAIVALLLAFAGRANDRSNVDDNGTDPTNDVMTLNKTTNKAELDIDGATAITGITLGLSDTESGVAGGGSGKPPRPVAGQMGELKNTDQADDQGEMSLHSIRCEDSCLCKNAAVILGESSGSAGDEIIAPTFLSSKPRTAADFYVELNGEALVSPEVSHPQAAVLYRRGDETTIILTTAAIAPNFASNEHPGIKIEAHSLFVAELSSSGSLIMNLDSDMLDDTMEGGDDEEAIGHLSFLSPSSPNHHAHLESSSFNERALDTQGSVDCSPFNDMEKCWSDNTIDCTYLANDATADSSITLIGGRKDATSFATTGSDFSVSDGNEKRIRLAGSTSSYQPMSSMSADASHQPREPESGNTGMFRASMHKPFFGSSDGTVGFGFDAQTLSPIKASGMDDSGVSGYFTTHEKEDSEATQYFDAQQDEEE